MNPNNIRSNPILLFFWPVFCALAGCGLCSDNGQAASDPLRCEILDAGDAMALVEQGNLVSDRMISTQGMADPRALVWRDQKTGEVYYITRLMGTEQRLFFRKRLASDEKPTILTDFTGHIMRWDELPEEQAVPIAKALAEQYDVHVVPDKTYLINADTKPRGCP